jgi:hypothetical protein
MIANALLVATAFLLALLFLLMGQLRFLIPWRDYILHQYWPAITLYCAMLFINIVAVVVVLQRKFLLKDSGRKLVHFDKQIHTGQNALSDEIRGIAPEED